MAPLRGLGLGCSHRQSLRGPFVSTLRNQNNRNYRFSTHGAVPARRLLMNVSQLRTNDHVVILGIRTLDYLLELVKSGCRNATASNPKFVGHLSDSADIVWLIGTEALVDEAVPFNELGTPRLVAIVLSEHDAREGVPKILARLRAKGLVRTSTHKASDGSVVVASRPAWLHQVL